MNNLHVRKSVRLPAMAVLLTVTGCGGGSSPTGGGVGDPGEITSVMVGNNFFSPEPILVSPGESVTWTWAGGGDVHNVTFASNAIPNSVTQPSGSYEAVMPTEPGVYTYLCTVHPTEMNGSVTVGSGRVSY